MRYLLISCLVFCSYFVGNSQSDSLAFPSSWIGQWTGQLEIYNAQGKQQELPMELHIFPIDTSTNYSWTIIYGADKVAGRRAYELVIVDAEKGLYRIDEKNSIDMEAYFIGNKFFNRFEVMNSLLLCTTELRADGRMEWEIVSGKLEAVSVTGGKMVGGEEIPAVQTFPIQVMQRAILSRE